MGVNCLCLLKEILLQTNIAAKLSHHGISHNTISMHAFDARLAGYHKLFSLKLNIYISTKFFVGLCLARLKSYLLADSQVVCTRSAVVWKMVPLCIMWFICRERNDRCFEDSSKSSEELLLFFFPFTLFTWTAGWLAPRVISFNDFLSFFSSPT
jgi:hypothetical protein